MEAPSQCSDVGQSPEVQSVGVRGMEGGSKEEEEGGELEGKRDIHDCTHVHVYTTYMYTTVRMYMYKQCT